MGAYVIGKVIPNNKYVVRRISNNEIRILYRIRLRKYNNVTSLDDSYQHKNFQRDNNIVIPRDDLYTGVRKQNLSQFSKIHHITNNLMTDSRRDIELNTTTDARNQNTDDNQNLDIDPLFDSQNSREVFQSTVTEQISNLTSDSLTVKQKKQPSAI